MDAAAGGWGWKWGGEYSQNVRVMAGRRILVWFLIGVAGARVADGEASAAGVGRHRRGWNVGVMDVKWRVFAGRNGEHVCSFGLLVGGCGSVRTLRPMSDDTTTGTSPIPGQPQRNWAPFDPSAAHHQRPRLRPIRAFGVQHEGQNLMGLADARSISEKVVFTSPAAQLILPHLTGEHDVDTIVKRVNESVASQPQLKGMETLGRPVLEQFIAQLDDAALIEGPNAEGLIAKARADFDSAPNLPPSVTAGFADMLVQQEYGEDTTEEQKREHGAKKLRGVFDMWIAESLKSAEDPSFDALPRAIVAPHIDYPRGWLNYGAVYGRMRVVDKPDRIVILGTNHFGFGTGVVGCDKGFATPLGVSPVAGDVKDALARRLGAEGVRRLFEHKYDHEREHSIELHVAWAQHVFGPAEGEDGTHVPVFAALVHDPTVKAGQSYDGKGLDLTTFAEAMRAALAELPGRTLIVSSADLSHVGPQFGDPTALAGEESENPQGVALRNKAIQQDRQMLETYAKNRPDELIAAMAWQKNPTRWCSIGNMVATLKIVQPREVRLLNYTAAMDQQGAGMVSSCAVAMF